MHHYSSRHSSRPQIKVQSHLSWSPIWAVHLISLGALRREGFSFSFEGDLIEVSKEVHVKFQAERVGIVYMLQNLKVTVSGLQLSSTSEVGLWNNQRL